MARVSAATGLVAGVLLILSAAAHSLMGGKAMGAQTKAAHVIVPAIMLLAGSSGRTSR